MEIDKFFSKIRNTNYIYVILIIGVAVMLLASIPGRDKEGEDKSTPAAKEFSEEERLENILSQIEGVGEVSVMVTYYGSSEKSLAYETKTDRRAESTNGSGSESSDEKAVLADGEPVVLKETYPRVKGVVVIADGVGNPTVKQAVCEAVSTSLGIAMHKICVLPKSE